MNEWREARSYSRETIGRLLQERSELLVLCNRVNGHPPFPPTSADEQRHLLQRLCERIEAYVATTDSRIYERVLTGRERRKELLRVAIEIYPQLTRSSSALLSFTRCYGSGRIPETDLETALETLAVELAARFRLERQVWEQVCRAEL